MTDQAAGRRRARPPASLGPYQMADALGVTHAAIDRARELQLLPEPDCDGRWSAAAVEALRGRWPQVAAGIEEARELGAARCAGLLAAATGLPVERADIDELAARGLLTASGSYKDWPLYRVADLEALAVSPAAREQLAVLVAGRVQWLAASLDRAEACARLGWSRAELEDAAAARDLTPGRFGRWARSAVEDLAADEDLAGEIRGRRLLGPDQAAAHLEIRRTDFDYCTSAGWISPAGYGESHITRRRTVDVPLYRTADVEALLQLPGVDWEAVRAARPGEPSPLREYAARPIARAALVRGFAADLSAGLGTEITARYDPDRDTWELHWHPRPDGQPGKQAIRAALRRDRDLAPHAASITLHPGAEHGGTR